MCKTEPALQQLASESNLLCNVKETKPSMLRQFGAVNLLQRGKFSSVHLLSPTEVVKVTKISEGDSEEKRKAAENETRVFDRINGKHPFFVKRFWSEMNGTTCALGLEFCQHGDLFDHMSSPWMTIPLVKLIVAEVAVALDFLHKNGVIHEDLKPENIGIGKDGHIRLLDFGISTIVEEDQDSVPEFRNSHGTVEYACPEKLTRVAHSFDADWWSLGVIAFELVFNSLPWTGESSQSIAASICMKPIECYQLEGDTEPACERNALDLVHKMLTRVRTKRLATFTGIRNHPFLMDVDLETPRPPFAILL